MASNKQLPPPRTRRRPSTPPQTPPEETSRHTVMPKTATIKVYHTDVAERVKRRRSDDTENKEPAVKRIRTQRVQEALILAKGMRRTREAKDIHATFTKHQLKDPAFLYDHFKNGEHDGAFVALVLVDLIDQEKDRADDIGRRYQRRIIQLLKLAQLTHGHDTNFNVTSAMFKQHKLEHPVFLQNQQRQPLMTVEEVFREFYDKSTVLDVQDPSTNEYMANTKHVYVDEVEERLLKNIEPTNPWNCLELACPFEDGTRPACLNDEDFRLLTKIKIPIPKEYAVSAGRRALENNYKEVEKWMLLAQSGALTETHQDSHGYGTYITVNDGIMGFGWLHLPTAAQRQQWNANPWEFVEGDWRCRILVPGTTVYFPPGTVHFVFRYSGLGPTLAFGGHVLRCSRILQWIETIQEQANHKDLSNEDLSTSAWSMVEQVAMFIAQAKERNESLQKWGGLEAINSFLAIKEQLFKVSTKVKKSKVRKS